MTADCSWQVALSVWMYRNFLILIMLAILSLSECLSFWTYIVVIKTVKQLIVVWVNCYQFYIFMYCIGYINIYCFQFVIFCKKCHQCYWYNTYSCRSNQTMDVSPSSNDLAQELLPHVLQLTETIIACSRYEYFA